jgi:flagellar motor switch protein FliM
MSTIIELFDHVWTESDNHLKIGAVLTRPGDATMMSQFEPMLRVGLRLTAPGSEPDELVVALTGSAVLTTVPRAAETPPIKASPNDRSRMIGRVVTTEIRAIAILGQTKSNIREVLSLRQGDVIRLDSVPNQPVNVRVGSIPVLRGMPVVHHGNLAVEITESLKGTKS